MVDGRGEAMDQGTEKWQGGRRLVLERVQGLSVQMSALQDTLMLGYGPFNTGYRYYIQGYWEEYEVDSK